jgi:hypothetical protein
LHIELVDDGKNQPDQKRRTYELVKKYGPEARTAGKVENIPRVIQVRIYQNPFSTVDDKSRSASNAPANWATM